MTSQAFSARRARIGSHWRVISVALGSLALLGCTGSETPPVSQAPRDAGLYQMPSDPSKARTPDQASPDRAAELAEAALHLLDPKRPSGPDYAGATRMCLLATEVAVPNVERDLQSSCFRVAASSALRSGDIPIYLEAVDRWERRATAVERASGELPVHVAIRDRLKGSAPTQTPSDPLLRALLDRDESAPPVPSDPRQRPRAPERRRESVR